MGYREELQKRIEKKQQEIAELDFRLHESQTYLQGLMEAMKLLPKEVNPNREITLRRGSTVALAREAILTAGQPLHISQILKAIGRPSDKGSRLSLSGSIAAYVRRGDVFTRPEPNTFGLIEMENAKEAMEAEPAVSLLEDLLKEKAAS